MLKPLKIYPWRPKIKDVLNNNLWKLPINNDTLSKL